MADRIIMNRNTSPISPFKEEDYQQIYPQTPEQNYPYQEIERFKAIYGSLNRVKPEEIELANGSDEWIQKVMISYGKGGVLTLAPDFFMYQDYAAQLDVEINFVKADQDYEFHLADILSDIQRYKPAVFILSNPHNPTGLQFAEAFLQTIADELASIGGILVIDEAYIEFGSDYQRPIGDHVVLLRTMSKIYGMAGLRIGVMHATGETFTQLTKINHPYPINNLVLNLASRFLEDAARLEVFIKYQKESRDQLVKAFDLVKHLVKVKDTASNFVFTYGPKAVELGLYLKNKGFEARFYDEKNMADVVRYSIIRLEDYKELGRYLEEWRNFNDQ